MNRQEIDELFKANMQQVAKMDTASGSMVKAFVQGIEQNGPAYVKLSGATKHKVNYTLVSGLKLQLRLVADALGVIVTDTYIEAYH